MYLRPGQVFTHMTKANKRGVATCELHGKRFFLSNAQPLLTGFPSSVIVTEVPERPPTLDLKGRSELFLEYDPLSVCLPDQTKDYYVSQHLDRFGGLPELNMKMVPIRGVRGAWVIQTGDLFWSRVFAQNLDGQAADDWNVTTGCLFNFQPGVGFVLTDGSSPSHFAMAIEHRAERAALMHT